MFTRRMLQPAIHTFQPDSKRGSADDQSDGMNSRRSIRISSPEELLAYVPQLIGMRPQASMVMVVLMESGRCGVARVDLAPFLDVETRDEAAREGAAWVRRLPAVTSAIPVFYTDARFGTENAPPHGDVVVRMIACLEEEGLEVTDALCVSPDGWASYLDHDGSGGRRELGDIEAVHCSALRPVLDASEELSIPTLRGAAHSGKRRITSPDYEQIVASEKSRAALVNAADRALAQSADEALVETLSTALGAPVLRDALICTWAWGAEIGHHLLRRIFEPERFRRAMDEDPWMSALAGRVDVAPSLERLYRATRVVKQVCERLSRSDRAPEYACLAWLYWAQGYSSFAKVWAVRAGDADDSYTFATLIQEIVERGVLPEWALTDRPVS